MPNSMSPDSRRANFIVSKDFYAGLEELAQKQRVTVSELIRRALEKEYDQVEDAHPVINVRPISKTQKKEAGKPVPGRPQKARRQTAAK